MATNTKKIGLYSAVCTGVGMGIGSCAFLSLGQGVGYGGNLFILSILFVGLLYICLSMTLTELSRIMPNCKGNTGKYMLNAFGPGSSLILCILTYFIIPIAGAAAECSVCAQVIHMVFLPNVSVYAITTTLFVVIGILNTFGLDAFAKVQNVVVTVMVTLLVVMAIVGCFKLSSNANIITTVPTQTGISGALTLTSWAFVLFIGFDLMTPMFGEMKNPRKDAFKSLLISVFLIGGTYMLLARGLGNYMNLDQLVGSDTPNMLYATTLFGTVGYYGMAIATIFAAVSTLNSSLQCAPRILSGCTKSGMFPKFLAKENKYGTPIVWTWLIVALQCFCVTQSNTGTLIMVGSAAYVIVYILLHAAVIKLRIQYPDADRDKHMILFNIPQIIGIIGVAYIEYTILQDHTVLFAFGSLFILALIYALGWIILKMKRNPFAAMPESDLLDTLKVEDVKTPFMLKPSPVLANTAHHGNK